MDDILNIIKQMRKSPPKGKDDPRFDELEEAVSMYGEDDALEAEGLGEDIGEEEEALDEEAPIDEDQALMDEAMGAEDDAAIEADESEEESEDPLAPGFKPKKKKNPLMKKSSYLDM